MSRAPLRLGLWWGAAALVLIGLTIIAGTGRLLVGGVVVAAAFAVAAVARAVLPEQRVGGLAVRTTGLDVLFYAAAATNVLGALLLVLRILPLRVLAVVDAAFLLALLVLWGQAIRYGTSGRRAA